MNPYLTGNTQYGASSSPTRGRTLDPTGYLNRNAQQRSQLAQTALQRTAQPGQTNQPNQTTRPAYNPSAISAPTFDNRTNTGRIIAAPIAEFTNPVAPTAPELAGGMPPDESYNTQAWQAGVDWQNTANQLLEQRQLAELGYAQKARQLQEQFDATPGQVRDANARQGMLRSSMFTGTMEDNLRSLENTLQEALSDRNFADQAYTKGLGNLTGNYSNLMALAAQTLASRNAANAGKLGLGTASDADKALTESEIGKMIQDMINNQPSNVPWGSGNTPSVTPQPQPTPPSGGAGASLPSSGIYRSGSRGNEVKTIQQIVGVNPDGVFGPRTLAAVKAWQQQHGLVADGVVGPKTLAAMRGA